MVIRAFVAAVVVYALVCLAFAGTFVAFELRAVRRERRPRR